MTPLWILLAVLLTALAAWCVLTAQRLDRLHIRLDRSSDALQAALDRRCAVLAAYYPELAGAARVAERVPLTARDSGARAGAEERLAEARAALGPAAGDGAALRDTADADARVLLALRFYNDAVADTRAESAPDRTSGASVDTRCDDNVDR